ncbi:MAG: hypothetical protein AB8H12_21530 [Lewinella sp.]
MHSFSLTLLLLTLICTCVRAQKNLKVWTDADRKAYAHRNDNPANWDSTMLAEDLEWHLEPASWPTTPAIASIPSPVADYSWGYCALRNLEITLGGKKVQGWNVGYAQDSFRMQNFTSKDAYYQSFFTLLVITDWPQSANRAGHIISRNYPHYLCTGKFKTSTGDLDWVQMQLADGQNFAIVAQRYFDLTQGRTLLAAQQKDGSLRFLQVDLSPGEVLRGGGVPGLEAYFKALAGREEVNLFFGNSGVVGSE